MRSIEQGPVIVGTCRAEVALGTPSAPTVIVPEEHYHPAFRDACRLGCGQSYATPVTLIVVAAHWLSCLGRLSTVQR